MSNKRPQEPYPPPPGYRFEPVAEDASCWQIEPKGTSRWCRQPRCRNKAKVVLIRTSSRSKKGYRWGCCRKHMYGRWVEGGRIWHWRLVPETPDGQ